MSTQAQTRVRHEHEGKLPRHLSAYFVPNQLPQKTGYLSQPKKKKKKGGPVRKITSMSGNFDKLIGPLSVKLQGLALTRPR